MSFINPPPQKKIFFLIYVNKQLHRKPYGQYVWISFCSFCLESELCKKKKAFWSFMSECNKCTMITRHSNVCGVTLNTWGVGGEGVGGRGEVDVVIVFKLEEKTHLWDFLHKSVKSRASKH